MTSPETPAADRSPVGEGTNPYASPTDSGEAPARTPPPYFLEGDLTTAALRRCGRPRWWVVIFVAACWAFLLARPSFRIWITGEAGWIDRGIVVFQCLAAGIGSIVFVQRPLDWRRAMNFSGPIQGRIDRDALWISAPGLMMRREWSDLCGAFVRHHGYAWTFGKDGMIRVEIPKDWLSVDAAGWVEERAKSFRIAAVGGTKAEQSLNLPPTSVPRLPVATDGVPFSAAVRVRMLNQLPFTRVGMVTTAGVFGVIVFFAAMGGSAFERTGAIVATVIAVVAILLLAVVLAAREHRRRDDIAHRFDGTLTDEGIYVRDNAGETLLRWTSLRMVCQDDAKTVLRVGNSDWQLPFPQEAFAHDQSEVVQRMLRTLPRFGRSD